MTNQTTTSAQAPDPRTALEVALTAARLSEPRFTAEDGREYVLLPKDFTARELTTPYLLPPYIHQQLTTDTADSLIQYTNRFSDERTLIVADIDALSIHAHMDWHSHNQAEEPHATGERKHSATLKLRESEEFKRWNELENTMVDQMVFAEFLDENSADIVDPSPAVMIEIARDLEATQGVVFKSSTRLQTGERSITYETETHTKGEMKVPTQFTLQIPLFQGEEPVDIVASFRFRPRSDGLVLGFVWRRVEFRRQAEFAAIATRVAEETGCPVIFGRIPS